MRHTSLRNRNFVVHENRTGVGECPESCYVTVLDPDQGVTGRFNCFLAIMDNDNDVNATDFFRLQSFR